MPLIHSLTLPELLEMERRLKEKIATLDRDLTKMSEQGLAYRVTYQEMAEDQTEYRHNLETVRAQVRQVRGY